MTHTRVLIADADAEYTSHLLRYLSLRKDLEVVNIACDGLIALQMIHTEQPDIVLMDLLLPRMDGLTLMNEIMMMENPPFIICLTEFYSHSCIEAARRHGAEYFLLKSVNPRTLETVLCEYGGMRRENAMLNWSDRYMNNAEKMRRNTREIMRAMGFIPKYSGCLFLTESVLTALRNPAVLSNMKEELYPVIARKMNSSTKNVERCIRTAIAAADADGHLSRLLGCPPTNKACIQYILEQIKKQEES